MDHTSARFIHTQRAFEQRYGIEYTPLVEEHIQWQIDTGLAELLHTKADGSSKQYKVTLGCSTKVIVAFDPKTGDICTALTSGMYKSKRIHNKKKRNPKRNKRTNFEL